MQSVRSRLLKYFLYFSCLIVIIFGALSAKVYLRLIEAAELSQAYETLQSRLNNNLTLAHNFFLQDAKQVRFHSEGTSTLLESKEKEYHELLTSLQELSDKRGDDSAEDLSIILRIKEGLVQEGELFTDLLEKIINRGMEDYGVEGAMRLFAHLLEETEMDAAEVLMLRRHEKDYIIRGQDKYIERTHKQLKRMHTLVEQQFLSDLMEALRTQELLNGYSRQFEYMVRIDKELGIRNNQGLFLAYGQLEDQLKDEMSDLVHRDSLRHQALKKEMLRLFIASVILLLFLSIMFSILLSRRLSEPVAELSQVVMRFLDSGFSSYQGTSHIQYRDSEIQVLTQGFNQLQNEIIAHIEDLNSKVKDRTADLLREKELVIAKNEQILDSLNYARSIQRSIIGDFENISSLIPQSFLLYQAKDIVSGDFTWAHRIGHGEEERQLFAVGDCTGHGVPAALLSIICYTALDEIAKKHETAGPSRILDLVRNKLAEVRLTSSTYKHEGMCISLCEYRPKSGKLTFAGSFQSISLARKNQGIERLKGDRIYIEIGSQDHLNQSFGEQVVFLQNGDMIYLYSDGFQDQFGGPDNRKLKAKRFQSIIEKSRTLSISHQYQYIQQSFDYWKGGYEQIDDVTVLGVQVERQQQGLIEQISGGKEGMLG